MDTPTLLDAAPATIAALGLAAVTPQLVITDIRERRLPNRLVGIAAAALVPALALRWMLDGTFPVAPAIVGVVAGLAYLVLAVGGGMGMGDVKLAAVLATGGALASPLVAIGGGMLAFLVGGIAAVIALIANRARGTRAPTAERAPASAATAARTAPLALETGTAEPAPRASIPFGPWMLLAHWGVLGAFLASGLG